MRRRIIVYNDGVTRATDSRRMLDGVGTPEEVAYGEGWHSETSTCPYEPANLKTAWERGRGARKQKNKLSQHSARQGPVGTGMKRKVAFDPPRQRIASDAEESTNQKIVRLYKSWTSGGQKPIEAIGELADNFGMSEAQVKQIVAGGARDFKSEKGYVAKLIDVRTGGVLARSEPHIANGEGLKKWMRGEAQRLINQGKRVKAEVAVVFFDPNLANDSSDVWKRTFGGKRLFPNYKLAELEKALAEGRVTAEKRPLMEQEIARRKEAGES